MHNLTNKNWVKLLLVMKISSICSKQLQQLSILLNHFNQQIVQPQKTSIDAADSLKGLLTKDVLKTTQLLGFNFRAAIGEPLTDLCASAIRSLGEKNKNHHKRK